MTAKCICNLNEIGSWMRETEVNENRILGTCMRQYIYKKKKTALCSKRTDLLIPEEIYICLLTLYA